MSAGLSEVQVRHGRQQTAPLVPEAGGGGGGAVQPPVQTQPPRRGRLRGPGPRLPLYHRPAVKYFLELGSDACDNILQV